MKAFILVCGCGFGLALSAGASAQLINIATGNGSTLPVGAGYIGQAGDIWNAFDASGGTQFNLPLVDSNGNATAAQFNFICQGAVTAANPPSQPFPDLTHYYMFDNSAGNLGFLVSGLDPSKSYEVVLYCASDDASNGDRSLIANIVGSTFAVVPASGNPMSTYSLGDNVIDVTLMPAVSGVISGIIQDGPNNSSGEIDINGMQLRAVPEPTTLAALGAGLVALALRRSKKR